MRAPLRTFLPLLLAAVFVAGCSSDRDVLIRVGKRTLTVDEFKAVAKGNETQYVGTPDQAKAALLQDLLRRMLLLEEAEQRGMFRDSAIVAFRRQSERQMLAEAVFRSLTPQRVGVSEAEVARVVAWRDTVSHLMVVYTLGRPMAEAAAAELKRGADFASVSDRFSAPGMLPPGGDFGFVQPGSMVAPLDRYLRTAPVGANVGPVEAPGQGWFVLRVTERRYQPQSPAESQPAVLREALRQRKRRLAALDAYNALKEEYGVRVEKDAAQTLFARFNPPTPGALDGLGQVIPEPAGARDESKVLATWDDGKQGGRYTLKDALDDLESSQRQPPMNNSAAIAQWLEGRALARVSLLEAHRRMLDQDPAIRRRMDAEVENHVLQAIYDQDISAEAQLIQLDTRTFYESIKGDFQRLLEITLETVVTPDSALAQSVMQHGSHAPSLAEALAMAKANVPVVTQTVKYPSTDPVWQMLQPTFMGLPPGETVGPTRTPQGWMIARIVSKQQRAAEFDELEPMLKQVVERQADEQRRDAALRRITEHLQKMYKPEVHPERLKNIPWPIEPIVPPSIG